MSESVWDYPRPPALEPCPRRVRVELGGVTIADSSAALRVLETSHPPNIYVPMDDVIEGALVPTGGATMCEWKGAAAYLDVIGGAARVARGAWHYPEPTPRYAALRGHVAFYPGGMDGCYLDDERVQAQAGGFYGGWITTDITGPFKGGPGTMGW